MNRTTNTFIAPGTAGMFQVRVWSAGSWFKKACPARLVDPNVFVGNAIA